MGAAVVLHPGEDREVDEEGVPGADWGEAEGTELEGADKEGQGNQVPIVTIQSRS